MQVKVQWFLTIEEIPKAQWDRLAEPLATPFFEWEWLAAMERSGAVGGKTGWAPCFLTIWRGDALIGAAPLYLKGHSRGEFVFDQEWAAVAQQLGAPYYPKMVGMSPFTPAGGYRFMLAADQDERALCRLMQRMIDGFCRENDIAGCHYLRVEPEWQALMIELGLSPWLHHALIWENQGYADFDAYLNTFKSKQRKNIRRERTRLREQNLRFEVIPGAEAPRSYFSLMYDFYADTCRKFYHWSHYLNRDLFEALGERWAERAAFAAAFDDEDPDPVAMALLVQKAETLYGRYWGCRGVYDHLHFELCYYLPIEWAISQGLRWFDAGSGSADHKRRRGFPARASYSLHRLYNPIMAKVWQDNIQRVNEMEQEHIDIINGDKPWPEGET